MGRVAGEPSEAKVDLTLICKGYFSGIESFLEEYESINRVLFKGLPDFVFEDAILQRTKELREELIHFENREDAVSHLKDAIEEVKSYLGGKAEYAECGIRE